MQTIKPIILKSVFLSSNQDTFLRTRQLEGLSWQKCVGLEDDDDAEPSRKNFRCQWVPTKDASGMEWSRNESFLYEYVLRVEHRYVFWIQWIADNILKRWGLSLEGEVWYQGENQVPITVQYIRSFNTVETLEAASRKVPKIEASSGLRLFMCHWDIA